MPRLVIRWLMLVIRSRPSPEMIVLGLCALLLLAVAVPAIVQTRERARLQATKDQLRRIGAGVQSHHDTFQRYPSSPSSKSQKPDSKPKPNESPQLISPLMILAPAGG